MIELIKIAEAVNRTEGMSASYYTVYTPYSTRIVFEILSHDAKEKHIFKSTFAVKDYDTLIVDIKQRVSDIKSFKELPH